MRNLTIRRNKTFVGCLGTMKICIEELFSEEIGADALSVTEYGERILSTNSTTSP